MDGISDIEGRPVSYNQMMLDHEKKRMNETTPVVPMGQMFFSNSGGHTTATATPVFNEVSSTSKLSGTGWGKGFLKTMPIGNIRSKHIPTLSGIKSNK
jgi:hypothetical protein